MTDFSGSIASIAYQLGTFMVAKDRNRWIETEHMKIYVRRGERIVLGRKRWVLDVASVEVYEEFRSQGLFTAVMGFIESLGFSIFVENLLNERLVGFFRGRKYVILHENEELLSPCAYMEDVRAVNR